MNCGINDLEKPSALQDVLVKSANTLYTGSSVDESINRLLELVAEFYNADRSYIFEFEDDGVIMHNTYEWCKEGVEPEIEMLSTVEISIIDRWMDFFNKKGEFYINSVNNDLARDSEEYKILEVQGISSLMAAPLRSGNRTIGFMGVDNPSAHTDTLIPIQFAAAFIVNDFQKRETPEQRILRAIGNSFVSMHTIDLVRNTQKEIRYNKDVADHVISPENADMQMRSAITQLTDKEHLEATLEFTDIMTASERMADANVISHDFLARDGHWCRGSFFAMTRGENGAVTKTVFTIQYIDKDKQRELHYKTALKTALENQNEIYAEMLHMQSCGIIAVRTDNGGIITMNDAATKLFGTPSAGTVLKDILSGIVSEKKDEIIAGVSSMRGDHESYSFDFAAESVCGKMYYVMAVARNVVLAGGGRITIITLSDITEKKKLENSLLILSETDGLTGIYNRRSGEQRAEALLSEGRSGMFCLLDVDKFKSINDNFGHTVGDKALIAIADCLRRNFRVDDVVMRLGGDEFAVYAAGVNGEEFGAEMIKRFLRSVEEINIPEMNGQHISVSLGAVLCHNDCCKFDEIYPLADAAMYICKNKPGNQFAFYHG